MVFGGTFYSFWWEEDQGIPTATTCTHLPPLPCRNSFQISWEINSTAGFCHCCLPPTIPTTGLHVAMVHVTSACCRAFCFPWEWEFSVHSPYYPLELFAFTCWRLPGTTCLPALPPPFRHGRFGLHAVLHAHTLGLFCRHSLPTGNLGYILSPPFHSGSIATCLPACLQVTFTILGRCLPACHHLPFELYRMGDPFSSLGRCLPPCSDDTAFLSP